MPTATWACTGRRRWHWKRPWGCSRPPGTGRRSTRALISLAQERIDAGRFDEAIAVLNEAESGLTGADGALVAAQRALALQRAGRVIDARDDFDRAVEAFETAGMEVEAAVVKQNRAFVHAYRGELDEADEDLDAAARIFSRHGQPIRNAEVLHNQGFVAARRGDLPRALSLFDEAQRCAAELGALRPEMLVDRVEVCLQAGLSHEGRALAEAAVGVLEEAGFTADVPEACLLAARGCEQDGDPSAARDWALRAVELFRDQQRPRWEILARYAVLRAQAAGESPPPELADSLLPTAGELRRAGWAGPAVEAEVLAVELLVGARRLGTARDILDQLLPGVARDAAAEPARRTALPGTLALGGGRRPGCGAGVALRPPCPAGLPGHTGIDRAPALLLEDVPVRSWRWASPWPGPAGSPPERCGGWRPYAQLSRPTQASTR